MLLEDGAWFPGTARRSFSATSGEVVFTTNLTGYQEVFTDPSYTGQILTMTAPMIGNYGINEEDLESTKPQVEGIVVRELSQDFSNWRASGALDARVRQEPARPSTRATSGRLAPCGDCW